VKYLLESGREIDIKNKWNNVKTSLNTSNNVQLQHKNLVVKIMNNFRKPKWSNLKMKRELHI